MGREGLPFRMFAAQPFIKVQFAIMKDSRPACVSTTDLTG